MTQQHFFRWVRVNDPPRAYDSRPVAKPYGGPVARELAFEVMSRNDGPELENAHGRHDPRRVAAAERTARAEPGRTTNNLERFIAAMLTTGHTVEPLTHTDHGFRPYRTDNHPDTPDALHISTTNASTFVSAQLVEHAAVDLVTLIAHELAHQAARHSTAATPTEQRGDHPYHSRHQSVIGITAPSPITATDSG